MHALAAAWADVLDRVQLLFLEAGKVEHVARHAIEDDLARQEVVQAEAARRAVYHGEGLGELMRRPVAVCLNQSELPLVLAVAESPLPVVLHGFDQGKLAKLVIVLTRTCLLFNNFVPVTVNAPEATGAAANGERVEHDGVAPADDSQGGDP